MRRRSLAILSAMLAVAMMFGCGGLRPHRDLLVAQETGGAGGAVEVTYYGCNAFLIESGSTRLLIDPFFTRPNMAKVAFGRPIPSDPARVGDVLSRLPDRVDAILITHAHYDHLMDVPMVRAKVGGAFVASATSCELVAAKDHPAQIGDVMKFGGATVRVLEASHDTICGILPFPGGVEEIKQIPPKKASDYICGQPFAFLVEVGGKSIYIDSGGTLGLLPPERPGGTDLAILGCALNDSRERFVPALERLRPRITFPSHQDNFFRPLDRQFRFGPGTNMGEVRSLFDSSRHDGEMVLLDFFDVLRL